MTARLKGCIVLAFCLGFVFGVGSVQPKLIQLEAAEVIEAAAETVLLDEPLHLDTDPPAEDPDEWLDFTATAYCACARCCGKWAYTQGDVIRGAYGEPLIENRTVAADPDVLPAGTVIEVSGQGTYTVADKGVSGNHIDIYYKNHNAALEYGRKEVKVRILK
ncbi:MAG: 3D domain-containing protein [Clostridia bacterium]|nr:3D domain-containing protein [Clostridia bacterium]